MTVNPLSLATKGYVANSLSIARAFNGDIDRGGVPVPAKIHPTGGIDLRAHEEDDIFMIINSFLFMVNK